MRTYQINVNGQDYTVEIDDLGKSPVGVLVNGKAFEVTISELGSSVHPVSKPQSIAQLQETYIPTVVSTFVETKMELQEKPTETTSTAPTPSGGLQQITAPMPGKILDISVKVGTQIKHGDTLCNLEAMKMKSPIRSATDGTVAQILISEGQNVNFGDVLFTLQ